MRGEGGGVEIRRAVPGDSDVLTAIAHAAKRHWGYPERFIVAWRRELTITAGFITAHPVFAACRGGEVVGCYALAIDGGKASLEHMWVLPGEIGNGVGRRLFRHAVAEARRRGAAELEIVSDPHAAGFYARMGARRVGDFESELEGRPRVLPIYALPLEGHDPTPPA